MRKKVLCVLVAMAVAVAYSVPAYAETKDGIFYNMSQYLSHLSSILSGNESELADTAIYDESPDDEYTLIETQDSEELEKFDEEKEIDLVLCEGEQSFTSDEEISALAEDYDLGNPEDIDEIIYVPLVKPDAILDVSVDAGNNKYYVKKGDKYEEQGELLRSSWYRYPGGTMTIEDSISKTYSFTASGGVSLDKSIIKAELNLAYGFEVTGKQAISDEQDVVVKAKHKRNVKAYTNIGKYKYTIYKKRIILNDKKCGGGTISKPLGVIFTIGKNVPI